MMPKFDRRPDRPTALLATWPDAIIQILRSDVLEVGR